MKRGFIKFTRFYSVTRADFSCDGKVSEYRDGFSIFMTESSSATEPFSIAMLVWDPGSKILWP